VRVQTVQEFASTQNPTPSTRLTPPATPVILN
jgi:hypothetical protein